MKLLKNIGTILAATAGIVWVIFKIMAGRDDGDGVEAVVKRAQGNIKKADEEDKARKEGLRNAKDIDDVANKLRDIHKRNT